MGWLKKLFKVSSHKSSQLENKYFYHDKTLSLSEEEPRSRELIDDNYQMEEEQHGRTLQRSLDIDFEPHENDYYSHYHDFPFLFPSIFRVCNGCSNEIDGEDYLSCMGGIWHPDCIRCNACEQPISNYEFLTYGNHPYHKSCYKELHLTTCDVCKEIIPASYGYSSHPFWSQKYCPSHDFDGTPRCCSCERMQPNDMIYEALDDGRRICLDCLDSCIMDTEQCQSLYSDVKKFYKNLGMEVKQRIPLCLVARQVLNKDNHLRETRGLCISQQQTPRDDVGGLCMDGDTEPAMIVQRCEVKEILVLYGLPRLLTGSILAHEMMHAWLRLNGYSNLGLEVEEGMCQVLSHMWLESKINIWSSSSKGKMKSKFERNFGAFVKQQIELDTSRTYGDGFRAGHRAVLNYGLGATLTHIQQTGCFPY